MVFLVFHENLFVYVCLKSMLQAKRTATQQRKQTFKSHWWKRHAWWVFLCCAANVSGEGAVQQLAFVPFAEVLQGNWPNPYFWFGSDPVDWQTPHLVRMFETQSGFIIWILWIFQIALPHHALPAFCPSTGQYIPKLTNIEFPVLRQISPPQNSPRHRNS